MKTLDQYSETEQLAMLTMMKIVADAEPQPANFNDLSEAESLQHAERSTRTIQARRRNGNGGRVLLDVTDDDREVRKQVQAYLKKRGIIPIEEQSK